LFLSRLKGQMHIVFGKLGLSQKSTTDRGSIALIEAGHHCVKTLSICAICLPAAYWSPR
jgi:hypothetical protein